MPVVGSPEDLALSGWDDAPDGGATFALGDVQGPADVRFTTHANVVERGEDAWRRMPWPVRDAVFDLPPPSDPSAVLVVGPDAIADQLRDRGADATVAQRLTLEALKQAAVVVMIEDPFPRLAPCVLAARRVLIADGTGPTFGLQPGIEFLGVEGPDGAVERANMARLHPHAMQALRVMGARAAREQRASLVYPRLTADL